MLQTLSIIVRLDPKCNLQIPSIKRYFKIFNIIGAQVKDILIERCHRDSPVVCTRLR